MKLAVRYQSQLRRALGIASEELEVEGPLTLVSLLHRLADRHGHAFRRFALGADGSPLQSLLYFVGDHQVQPGDPALLGDGQTVTLLAPMAGG